MSEQSPESVTRVGTESHASQSQLSSKSRTDGRTDGLTKNHSPSDTDSRNATPAGGHSESTSSQPVSPDPSVPQVATSFAYPCSACGRTIHVDGILEQPHDCDPELATLAAAWWAGHDHARTTPDLLAAAGSDATVLSASQPPPHGGEEPADPSVSVPQPDPSAGEGSGDHAHWFRCDGCDASGPKLAPGPEPVVFLARVDLDLDKIEARANAATPGPWQAFYGSVDENGQQCYYVGRPTATVSIDDITGDGMPKGDAEFVAHARSDVPALVAEVRRLRETLAMANYACEQANRLTAGQKKLTDKAAAERDAARAEADRLRERINGQAETISTLRQVAAEAGRVMEALTAHGPSIVPHLMDTDDNAGERLRELLREVSIPGLDAALDGAE